MPLPRRALWLAFFLGACSQQTLKAPPSQPVGAGTLVPTVFFPIPVDTGTPEPNVFDMWGRAVDDIWVVGEALYVAHYDGKHFMRSEVAGPGRLDPAHGCKPCDPGTGGGPPSKTCVDFPAVIEGTGGTGGDAGMAGAGGTGGDGGEGGGPPAIPDLRGLSGRELAQPPPAMGETAPPPKSELWTAGTQGTVLHFDGDQWTVEPVVQIDATVTPPVVGRVTTDLNAIASSGGNVVVVGLGGLVAVRNEKFCRFEIAAPQTQENLNAVRLQGDEMIAVGNLGVMVTGAGGTYQKVPHPGLTSALQAIWGQSSSNFYVAGLDGSLLRSSGAFPTPDLQEITGAPSVYLRDMWGTSMNDVFLVGWSGTIAHYDGKKVELLADQDGVAFTTDRLEAVWGFPSPPVDPKAAPPPARALKTGAGTVFVGGVTGTFLRGP